jgi:NhaA family Na+:H+ antiporter
LIFVALNVGRSSTVGWAVPMATDIAFAVGAIVLLGNRVTPALRVLLMAVAVICVDNYALGTSQRCSLDIRAA